MEEAPPTQKPISAYYVATVNELRCFLEQKTITLPPFRIKAVQRKQGLTQKQLERINALKELYAALSKYDPPQYRHMLSSVDGVALLSSAFSRDPELRTALTKISFPKGIYSIDQLEDSLALVFHSEIEPAVAQAHTILKAFSHLPRAAKFPLLRHPIVLEVKSPPDLFDIRRTEFKRLIHTSETGIPTQHITAIHVHHDMPADSSAKLINWLSEAGLDDAIIKRY